MPNGTYKKNIYLYISISISLFCLTFYLAFFDLDRVTEVQGSRQPMEEQWLEHIVINIMNDVDQELIDQCVHTVNRLNEDNDRHKVINVEHQCKSRSIYFYPELPLDNYQDTDQPSLEAIFYARHHAFLSSPSSGKKYGEYSFSRKQEEYEEELLSHNPNLEKFRAIQVIWINREDAEQYYLASLPNSSYAVQSNASEPIALPLLTLSTSTLISKEEILGGSQSVKEALQLYALRKTQEGYTKRVTSFQDSQYKYSVAILPSPGVELGEIAEQGKTPHHVAIIGAISNPSVMGGGTIINLVILVTSIISIIILLTFIVQSLFGGSSISHRRTVSGIANNVKSVESKPPLQLPFLSLTYYALSLRVECEDEMGGIDVVPVELHFKNDTGSIVQEGDYVTVSGKSTRGNLFIGKQIDCNGVCLVSKGRKSGVKYYLALFIPFVITFAGGLINLLLYINIQSAFMFRPGYGLIWDPKVETSPINVLINGVMLGFQVSLPIAIACIAILLIFDSFQD